MVRVEADDVAVFKRKKRFRRDREQLNVSEQIAELKRKIAELESVIKKNSKNHTYNRA